MSIICLFGEDKTGKTLLTNLLIEYLDQQGYNVRRSWMRGSHTLASLISKFLSSFKVLRFDGNPYYGISIPRKMVNIWWLLEYISVLPIILTRYLMPCWLKRTVVADRYIQDFIVWVSIITDSQSFKKSIYCRQLLLLTHWNTVNFYITASREEINRRSKEKIITLQKQKELYKVLSDNSYKIDTTKKNPEKSLKEIITILRDLGFK